MTKRFKKAPAVGNLTSYFKSPRVCFFKKSLRCDCCNVRAPINDPYADYEKRNLKQTREKYGRHDLDFTRVCFVLDKDNRFKTSWNFSFKTCEKLYYVYCEVCLQEIVKEWVY